MTYRYTHDKLHITNYTFIIEQYSFLSIFSLKLNNYVDNKTVSWIKQELLKATCMCLVFVLNTILYSNTWIHTTQTTIQLALLHTMTWLYKCTVISCTNDQILRIHSRTHSHFLWYQIQRFFNSDKSIWLIQHFIL